MTVDAKPCGFRTHLGNRFAIPTLPPPRRLLDSFNTKSRKELSSAIPSGFLQAHSSIGKDWDLGEGLGYAELLRTLAEIDDHFSTVAAQRKEAEKLRAHRLHQPPEWARDSGHSRIGVRKLAQPLQHVQQVALLEPYLAEVPADFCLTVKTVLSIVATLSFRMVPLGIAIRGSNRRGKRANFQCGRRSFTQQCQRRFQQGESGRNTGRFSQGHAGHGIC